MRLRHLVLALVGAAVLLAGEMTFAQNTAPPRWSATNCPGGVTTRLRPAFQKTRGAARDRAAPGVPRQCRRAHEGPDGAATRAPLTPSVKKLTQRQIDQNLLKCHEKAGRANYTASAHSRMSMACTWSTASTSTHR